MRKNKVAGLCKTLSLALFGLLFLVCLAMIVIESGLLIIAIGIFFGGGIGCLLIYALGEIISLLNQSLGKLFVLESLARQNQKKDDGEQ